MVQALSNPSHSPTCFDVPMEKQSPQKRLKAEVVVLNKRGLHMRFAGKISNLAGQFNSNIIISKGRKGVDARNVLDLMMLSAAPGTHLKVTVTGNDADSAINAVSDLFINYLGDN